MKYANYDTLHVILPEMWMDRHMIQKVKTEIWSNTSGFIPVISSGSLRHWLRSRVPTTTRSSPFSENYKRIYETQRHITTHETLIFRSKVRNFIKDHYKENLMSKANIVWNNKDSDLKWCLMAVKIQR